MLLTTYALAPPASSTEVYPIPPPPAHPWTSAMLNGIGVGTVHVLELVKVTTVKPPAVAIAVGKWIQMCHSTRRKTNQLIVHVRILHSLYASDRLLLLSILDDTVDIDEHRPCSFSQPKATRFKVTRSSPFVGLVQTTVTGY